MTIPTVTPIAPPPLRGDAEDDFIDDADAFVASFPEMVTELNASIGGINAAVVAVDAAALTAVNAPGTSATSTTSNDVGTGTKSWGIQTGKALVPGMFLTIARTSAPGNWMHGSVQTYNSGTGALVMNITKFRGSGTGIIDWTLSLAPPIDFEAASASDILAGTSDDVAITPAGLLAAAQEVAVADAATITLNLANGEAFAMSGNMGGNRTIANPSGIAGAVGRWFSFKVRPGGFAPVFGSYWDFGAYVPSFSTDTTKCDIVTAYVRSATHIEARLSKGFTI